MIYEGTKPNTAKDGCVIRRGVISCICFSPFSCGFVDRVLPRKGRRSTKSHEMKNQNCTKEE
jgi:hypothetical protein